MAHSSAGLTLWPLAPCFGPLMAQGIMVGACDRGSPFTSWWLEGKEKETRSQNIIQRAKFCYWASPPKCFYLLPIAPWAGDQTYKTWAIGGCARSQIWQLPWEGCSKRLLFPLVPSPPVWAPTCVPSHHNAAHCDSALCHTVCTLSLQNSELNKLLLVMLPQWRMNDPQAHWPLCIPSPLCSHLRFLHLLWLSLRMLAYHGLPQYFGYSHHWDTISAIPNLKKRFISVRIL